MSERERERECNKKDGRNIGIEIGKECIYSLFRLNHMHKESSLKSVTKKQRKMKWAATAIKDDDSFFLQLLSKGWEMEAEKETSRETKIMNLKKGAKNKKTKTKIFIDDDNIL